MLTRTSQDGDAASPVARAAASTERATIVGALRGLVSALGAALGAGVEVVLHDVALLPKSIVAITGGDLTGRAVGDPATDVLLTHLRGGAEGHLIGYDSAVGDRVLQSSTLLIRDSAGTVVAALCVNADVTDWKAARALLERVSTGQQIPPRRAARDEEPAVAATRGEEFAHSVEGLTKSMIENAVAAAGVPVDLMKKQHKVAVVRDLERRGLFLVRDAVESTAAALKVSRFTIYNYLNEIAAERGERAGGGRGAMA